MITQVQYPEWRDETRLTSYPFEHGCSLLSKTKFRLPNDLFLDGVLYPAEGTEELYLVSIEVLVKERKLTLNIGVSSSKILATANIDLNAPNEIISFYDVYGRPAGVLVTNLPSGTASSPEVLLSWGDGVHNFASTATRFAVQAIVPMPQTGLRGILLDSGELFTGPVWIIGERGVCVRKVNGKLRIDIIGETLAKQRICQELNEQGLANEELEGTSFVPLVLDVPSFLKTINGQAPDEDGTFYIKVAGDKPILRVKSENGVVKLELIGR